jgi:hypothetical protein
LFEEMNMNKPSVYIYGMPISKLDSTIYGGLFGNATRSVGLALNLAKIGHKVFLEVEDDFSLKLPSFELPELFQLVTVSCRQNVLQDADILLVSCTNLESIAKLFGRDPYIEHPCKVIASCFDLGQSLDLRRLQQNVKFITFNNSAQKRMWDTRRCLIKSVEIPYGVNELDAVDDAIVDVRTPSALWMGAIRRPGMLERIIRFSRVNSDCGVSVVTRTIVDSSIAPNVRGGRNNPYADFCERDELSVFDDVVEELCGVETPSNIEFLGPMEGLNHILQGQHMIGLDFSRFPSQTHDNTKILDYLRSGMCVICDKGTPSYRFVEETGHGVVVSPKFDDDEIRAAFEKCRTLATYERRKEVARYVREKYGWNALAPKFSDLLCQSLELSAPSSLKRTQQRISSDLRRIRSAVKRRCGRK